MLDSGETKIRCNIVFMNLYCRRTERKGRSEGTEGPNLFLSSRAQDGWSLSPEGARTVITSS
jgi:hypothetical protein